MPMAAFISPCFRPTALTMTYAAQGLVWSARRGKESWISLSGARSLLERGRTACVNWLPARASF